MNLTPEQLILIGVISSGLVQVLKWGMAIFKLQTLKKEVIIALTFGISTVLAFIWMGPALPALDPENLGPFINALMAQASAIFGLAMGIYGILFETILKKVSLTTTDVITQRLIAKNPGGGPQ